MFAQGLPELLVLNCYSSILRGAGARLHRGNDGRVRVALPVLRARACTFMVLLSL